MIAIREELTHDIDEREELLDAAFGPARFAKTCERLRAGRLPARGLALVARGGGALLATIRLWDVSAGAGRPALLLGPLAVDARHRGLGLGAAMMEEALARAAERGHAAVLLVGDAPYYTRFGFTAAPTENLRLPGPYERGRFLARELVPGALAGARGLVRPTGQFAAPVALAA